MTKSADASLSTQWQHDSPEHDDMVVKADGRSRESVNGTAGARLAEVLPAGATRKLLREPNR
jgi:hypothetical protein